MITEDALNPGDTVKVRAGVYKEAVSFTRSGTPDAPITFAATPEEPVTVQGLKLQPGASHLRFHGFTLWRAEFTSVLWRFVDGVEFLFDDNGRRIDIRLASGVGFSDLCVNRRRIEDIRRRFSDP